MFKKHYFFYWIVRVIVYFQERVRSGAVCPQRLAGEHEAQGAAPTDRSLPEAELTDDWQPEAAHAVTGILYDR